MVWKEVSPVARGMVYGGVFLLLGEAALYGIVHSSDDDRFKENGAPPKNDKETSLVVGVHREGYTIEQSTPAVAEEAKAQFTAAGGDAAQVPNPDSSLAVTVFNSQQLSKTSWDTINGKIATDLKAAGCKPNGNQFKFERVTTFNGADAKDFVTLTPVTNKKCTTGLTKQFPKS